MSTARSDAERPHAPDLADRLAGAGFVSVVARADGDGVAAAGTIARALAERGTPFKVTAARTTEERTRRVRAADDRDDDVSLSIGPCDADVPSLSARPASVVAREVARELGRDDPVLALAGAVAAGATPGAGATEPLLAAAESEGLLERRPGVAAPTDDPLDGLAHSTLVHGPFSGSPERASETLAGVDATDGRALASAVACSVAGADGATPRAATVVERVLRPYATEGPFATLSGYADVLGAVARESPGTAVALALGHDVREPALAAWRSHASRAHAAVRSATTSRYDGVFAARVDGASPVTVTRLLSAFRSPEPVAVVVSDDAGAAAAREPCGLDRATERARDAVEGSADATDRTAYVEFGDGGDPTAFLGAFREALA